MDVVSVDAIAVEYDEVFEVYTAMFGLFIQKKYAPEIRAFLDEHYNSEKMQYSMMFLQVTKVLWEINLPINYLKGFDDSFTIEEVYQLLYSLIFKLMRIVNKLIRNPNCIYIRDCFYFFIACIFDDFCTQTTKDVPSHFLQGGKLE